MGNPGLCAFVVDQEFSMKIWTHVHWVLVLIGVIRELEF